MVRSPLDRALLAISLAAAGLWFIAMVGGHDSGAALFAKGLAVPALAAIAWRRQQVLLAAALLLHGIGDVLIEGQFLAGMAAFLVGHLLYLALFLKARRIPLPRLALVRMVLLGLLGAAALTVLSHRLEGVLALAVPIYGLALLLMAASAQLSRHGQPWLSAGAILFVASDLLLAFELFGGGTPLGGLPVWPTYWIAQVLIAMGWLRDVGRARSS